MADIPQEKARWEATTLKKVLDRFPERQGAFETTSGIPVERLSTPADADLDYDRDLGFSGEPPYTRGIQPTMYRGRLWTMRQYAGYATAQESNQRYKYLLQQGQTGLSVAFDLPTQLGYDADHPLAEGEVGKVGVSISSLEDMEALFGVSYPTIKGRLNRIAQKLDFVEVKHVSEKDEVLGQLERGEITAAQAIERLGAL